MPHAFASLRSLTTSAKTVHWTVFFRRQVCSLLVRIPFLFCKSKKQALRPAFHFGGELGIRTLGTLRTQHFESSCQNRTWRNCRKITADERTPKMPCFQGFAYPFASKTQRKSESESLLRFCRVLTDFRKSLLEFLIEPSDFSPQNHAFGSA